MKKQKSKFCVGFRTEPVELGKKPERDLSLSCEGCIGWSPIVTNKPSILEDGTVNCYNYLEVKK